MQRLESVTIQHHRVPFRQELSFSRLLLAEWAFHARRYPTWHTCLVASRGRGSRVTVPDYQQICGESIASQANRSIDWLIAWLIDEKSACDERVHVENENEPNGKWFRSIGRQQGNESFRRRRWRNICLFVSRLSTILVHENVYLSCVSWHASAKKKKKTWIDLSFVERKNYRILRREESSRFNAL